MMRSPSHKKQLLPDIIQATVNQLTKAAKGTLLFLFQKLKDHL
ncbi:hypothetical protein [Acinetobacter sp. XS-4]|nr:hypothetical protein [Acinetobacter sp. XS-4]